MVLDQLTFLSRLAAQVPPPRRHQLTYHGVLAPAAGRREEIVPGPGAGWQPRSESDAAVCQAGPSPAPPRDRPERFSWPELMQRSFARDVLQCRCGARRRVLRLVCDPAQIRRVLEHLGLPADPPERAPPRAVQGVMGFG